MTPNAKTLDPNGTWPLASYSPKERRAPKKDRRHDPRRSVLGERRTDARRALTSLLRF